MGGTEEGDYCESAINIMINGESEREMRLKNVIMRDILYGKKYVNT